MLRSLRRLAVLGVMMFVVQGAAAGLLEDFEDDTAGSDPTELGWAFAGSDPSVTVTSGQSDSGVKSLVVPSPEFFKYSPPPPFNFCTSANYTRVEWDARVDATPSGVLVLGGVGRDTIDTADAGLSDPSQFSDAGEKYWVILDGGLVVQVAIGSSASNQQTSTGVALNLDTWYHFKLDQQVCGTSVRITISGGHLGSPQVFTITCAGTNCDGGTFDTMTTFVGGRTGSSGTSGGVFIDDIQINGTGAVVPTQPEAPPGLSALVVEPKTTTDPQEEGTIELTWPLSVDDPDQEQGDYEYLIFIDGTNVGVDSTTPNDGDGVRFNQVILGGTEVGSFTAFAIKARNATSQVTSTFSCTVTVDTSVVGDSDTCGSGAPGGQGVLDFTTPDDTAAGLAGFGADLMGDSLASKFLFGLILVTIVFLGIGAAFAALAGAPGLPAVIAGAVAAFGTMIFLVIAQIWSLGAAAVIILLATGVALALMRRLFFGGGGRG